MVEVSDKMYVLFGGNINKLNLELISLDPGFLNVTDVDKLNDYSIINDWFDGLLYFFAIYLLKV